MSARSNAHTAAFRAPVIWAAAGTASVCILTALFQRLPDLPDEMRVASGLLGALSLGIWLFLARPAAVARRRIARTRKVYGSRSSDFERLAADLEAVGAKQGVRQLQALRHKFEMLIAFLESRIASSEYSYVRFLSQADRILQEAIENIRETESMSRNLIDIEYIDRRMFEIRKTFRTDPSAEKELDALGESKFLFEKQRSRINELLANNEALMTKLDWISSEIANCA